MHRVALSRTGYRLSLVSILLAGILAASPVLADVGSKQFEYAASGRFDQLERLMEEEQAKHALNTMDLHGLCFAYSKTKRYDRLMPCLDQLEQNVKKGDTRTRLFGLDDATPAIHTMRADALLELGQYARAAQEAKKGLAWLREEHSDDRDMEINCLAVLSMAATLSGDKETGAKYAAEIGKIRPGDYAHAKAMALGRTYIALGDYQKALDGIYSDSTFKLRSFLDNLVSGALFTGVNNWVWAELPRGFMINKALLETGKVGEAKVEYDRLLNIPQTRANGEIYWLILDDRGRIAEKEGDLNGAINFYKKAIDVIEQQRSSINTEANKIGFVGDKQALYGHLISALYRAHRETEAYEYMERAKARALVDVLAARDDFAVPKSATIDAAKLLKNYREADREARTQLPVDMTRSLDAPALHAKIRELKSAAPELASLVSVSPVSQQEIRQKLSPHEALVEYYSQGGDWYAAVLTQDKMHVTHLDAKGLDDSIRSFRRQIEERNPNIQTSARTLYNQLLRPLTADISNRGLLIIPHGALHYLPFAALHDGKDYLVQSHALHYLPSAGVLKYLRPPRTQGPDSILVFGNPDLGNPQLDLPSAEEEARKVAAMINHGELLVRDKATKTAFKRFAPSFQYLHIASHGQFNAANPLDSRLLFSTDNENDGSLTAGELYSMRLDADLITLSACETGLGKVLSGDDLVGLTRGFLYSGGRNVIASLWEVDDAATAELMQRFYTHLKNHKTKLEALRQAQQDTRLHYPHPFFWAAFFLTGQGN